MHTMDATVWYGTWMPWTLNSSADTEEVLRGEWNDLTQGSAGLGKDVNP